MKKSKLFLTAALAVCYALVGISCASKPQFSSTEVFSNTIVYNPTSKRMQIISIQNSKRERLCWVEPKERREISLGNEHSYYFAESNGKKISELPKNEYGEYLPIYLESNELEEGERYILMPPFFDDLKNPPALESTIVTNKNGEQKKFYRLCLYKLGVDKGDNVGTSYYYHGNYLSPINFPSAALWIDNEAWASNWIATSITYNATFRNYFKNLSNDYEDWDWSSYNIKHDMDFYHRVRTSFVSPKNTDGYFLKQVGKKTSVTFYNPTENDISIYTPFHKSVTTVKAGEISQEDLYLQYPYYFDDDKKRVEIKFYDENTNFMLRLEKPIDGKKYLCLGYGKKNEIATTRARAGLNHYSGFYLYEVVDKSHDNAYKYSDNLYICYYPSAIYWFDDDDFSKKFIGTEITYSEDFFNQFELKDNSSFWGYATKKDKKSYMHFGTKKLFSVTH